MRAQIISLFVTTAAFLCGLEGIQARAVASGDNVSSGNLVEEIRRIYMSMDEKTKKDIVNHMAYITASNGGPKLDAQGDGHRLWHKKESDSKRPPGMRSFRGDEENEKYFAEERPIGFHRYHDLSNDGTQSDAKYSMEEETHAMKGNVQLDARYTAADKNSMQKDNNDKRTRRQERPKGMTSWRGRRK